MNKDGPRVGDLALVFGIRGYEHGRLCHIVQVLSEPGFIGPRGRARRCKIRLTGNENIMDAWVYCDDVVGREVVVQGRES